VERTEKFRGVCAAVAAILIVAAGCSSSSKPGGNGSVTTTPTPRTASPTPATDAATSSTVSTQDSYTIGVLTEMTGLLSPAEHTSVLGVKAAVGLLNAQGYKIKYVVADTATSPATALAGAQRLVDQDHVFAVVMVSGVGFAAAPYLASKGIPVIGAAVDGPEWVTSRNMFSIFGTPDFTKVETTTGEFLKLIGATNFAAIGYGISPSSSEAAKASAVSAQLAGIKVGYLNANFPFGTNVGPLVLAMKSAGVDSFVADVVQSTSFAILAGLSQQGVHLKAPLLAVGYGGDMLQAGPAAEQQAQGAYVSLGYEPVELHTAATERLVNAMQTYAGVPPEQITYNEYQGYLAVDAFATGLKAAGAHPTQTSFIDAMLGIRTYDAAGLLGGHTLSFAMDNRGAGGAGADNCLWMVQWSGSSFKTVQGAEPICGTVVPGKTVSASS
jgi:ABC-type branched-subunit amino acid transport system substrate-binding protein